MNDCPKVLKLLDEPDPMMNLVLVGHLNIEALLTMILQARLEKPDAVLDDRATFMGKLRLARAIGAVSDDQMRIIKSINKVRNRYAHQLGYVLTFDEAFDLVQVAAGAGVDFSDETIHEDKEKSREWYGVSGVLHEVLANTFMALAFAHEDVPGVLDTLA